jgi:trehalose synthase
MYGTLAPTAKRIEDYVPLAGREAIDGLKRLAKPFKGLRVLNLSVTAFGTGVAELLRSSVPLLSDLGLDCQWQVVHIDEESARVNKQMYRALAGGRVDWDERMVKTWQHYTAMNADLLRDHFDVVIIHDLQPAALRTHIEKGRRQRSRWIMYSHIDLSSAQDDVWSLVRRHIQDYDALVFEDETFLGKGLDGVPVHIIPPAIDPSGPRNMRLSQDAIARVLDQYGINRKRPLVAQVAPCSKDCDALGAIEAFRLARERVPGLQLVLMVTSLPEDPFELTYFETVAADAARHPEDIHFLSNPGDVGNVEVNVVQRAAKVVMQRALRKGFGIWLSDALWKEKPVVAAPMGGIPKQVIHGKTGYLANTTEEFAGHIVNLIGDGETAQALGAAGRQHVTDNFLVCRYLRDYLHLLEGIV